MSEKPRPALLELSVYLCVLLLLRAGYWVWQGGCYWFTLVLFVLLVILFWPHSFPVYLPDTSPAVQWPGWSKLPRVWHCFPGEDQQGPYHQHIWTAWHCCCEQSFRLCKWKTAVVTAHSLVVPQCLEPARLSSVSKVQKVKYCLNFISFWIISIGLQALDI